MIKDEGRQRLAGDFDGTGKLFGARSRLRGDSPSSVCIHLGASVPSVVV